MDKRIVFFVSSMGDGGAQRVISILSERLAQANEKVEIVSYLDLPPVYTISEKVSYLCVCKSTGTNNILRNIVWIRNYLKENAAVIVSFLAPYNIIALTAAWKTSIPIIVADRNDPRRVPNNFFVRKLRDFLYRYANSIVAQTENNKHYFSDAVQKKTTVIYNPIGLEKSLIGAAVATEKEKVIVSVGRLEPQKNQKCLIESFDTVHQKYPEYKLVIYGEGSERQELERFIAQYRLNGFVELPGATTDVLQKIRSAEMFVLSSDYEGMPNALIEAMCLGLPVISTKVSGATDLINDGNNGLLVECNRAEELAQKMLLLIENSVMRYQLGMNATRIAEQLDVAKVTEQWKLLIERVKQ